MLTLYYARPSLYSRPVWLALLEKKLSFELIPLKLDGDQLTSKFRSLNPFGRIPVLVDNNFRIFESSAILDYLEVKYPMPALLPTKAEILTKVRMVQMIATNELLPAVAGLLIHDQNPPELEYARQRAINVLAFFEQILENHPYFGGEQLTLAEIVSGTIIPDLPKLGIPLINYPKLDNWAKRLLLRESWQQIQLSSEELNNFKRSMRLLPKIWQKRRRQRMNALAKPHSTSSSVAN
ncbi:glutathione S-transferase family protein [Pleurocapsales cyanobacterium LEGE 06147]|nr:glutathione S-transferase family protein [Pleurocapsales cyanobacterium LEGE 06147]